MSELNRFQDEVWGSLQKYSQKLGWGLSGIQPECWTMLDMAVDELVQKRIQVEMLSKMIGIVPALKWTFDGTGEWSANSRYCDDGIPFRWVIGVCDDGTFTLAGSDPELGGKSLCFPSLVAAKEHCQILEKN